jgi:hypothetical protein
LIVALERDKFASISKRRRSREIIFCSSLFENIGQKISIFFFASGEKKRQIKRMIMPVTAVKHSTQAVLLTLAGVFLPDRLSN